MDDPQNLTPFKERGWKPVIGGIRHLTRYVQRPRVGRVVTLLCGDSYLVAKTGRVRSNADCLACYQERVRQRAV